MNTKVTKARAVTKPAGTHTNERAQDSKIYDMQEAGVTVAGGGEERESTGA
jgi:hypothetical protein